MNHILVPRAAIPTDHVLTFELFVKVNDRFVKVANQGESIDPERINRYLSHERDVLYIDREKFGSIFEMISNPATHIEERFEWFIRCLELGFIDLKIVGAHTDKFMRIQLLVDWCYEFFRKRELRKVLVRKTYLNVEQLLTKRALFGAVLTLSLAMEQNDCTPNAFRSMFTGALFRDISLLHAEGQDDPHLLSVSDMNEAQQLDWMRHPEQAVEVLRKYITVDDVIRAIVEQHHELPRGDGFPRRLKRAETFQPAQYLSLADFTITELEKFKRTNGKMAYSEEALAHLQKIMPEENLKNLPLLLRVLTPIFASQKAA